MKLVLNLDQSSSSLPSGFVNDVNYVETYFDSLFTNNITVTIDVGYGEIDGQSLGSNDLGESEQANINAVSYAAVRNALIAEGAPGASSLPATSPQPGTMYMASSEEKALGLMSNNNSLDGYVGFSDSLPFSYALNQTPASSAYYFIGVLEHEVTEVMGRVSYLGEGGYAAIDLYRYSSPGQIDTTTGGSGSTAYFSINQGATNLGSWNNDPSNGDLADWYPSGPAAGGDDAFNDYSDPGVVNVMSQNDITLMETLGYNEVPQIFGSAEFSLSAFGANLSAGGWGDQATYPVALGDVNGDGMDDIVGFGSAGVYVSLATGGGNFAEPILALSAFGADAGWGNQDQYPIELGDVTGNGRDDIVAFGSAGVYVSLSNANGTFSQPILALSAFGADAGWGNQNQYPTELGDVTGNGRDDIVAFGSAGVYVSLSNGNGTFSQPILALSAFGADAGWGNQAQYPIELGDVTGNGRDDIVAFGSAGVYVSLSNGNGTFSQPTLALDAFGADAGWGNQQIYPIELADVTGNGLDDMVGFGADGVYVALANGNGTFQQPFLALPNEFGAFSSAGGWTSQNEYPRLLGDVTGNGMADIVGFGQAGVFVALANGGASSGAKQSARAASGGGPIISGVQTIDTGAAIDSPTIDGGTLSLSTGAIVNGPITFAAGGTGTLFDADGLNDTVVGFSEGRTFLSFNGETPASEAQVIASATSANGNTILSFPDHTSVVLLGVTHPDIGIFG